MSASYGKGAKAKATRLHSKIVRIGGVCQRCGAHGDGVTLQCAHIVRRTYATTRTDTDNGWCLCAKCHWAIDADPDSFMCFVRDTIGLRAYRALKKKANLGVGVKMDWDAEATRLEAIWKELQ